MDHSLPFAPELWRCQDRAQTRSRIVQRALLVMLVVVTSGVLANSAMAGSSNHQEGASAHLTFTIVIPAVLIIDRETGTFFSNDSKAVVAFGRSEMPVSAMRTHNDAPGQADLRPGGATNRWRNEQGGRVSGKYVFRRPITEGDVICIP